LGGSDHRNDVGVDRRLAARKLDDFGMPFRGDEPIQDRFHFAQSERIARARVGETQRAVHIARAVDLDDAQTRVLLMVGTKTAIVRTTTVDGGRKAQRNRAGLVESRIGSVGLGISVDERFKQPMLGATLAHEHFVIAQQDLRVNHPPTLWTDTAREFVENIVGVLFLGRDGISRF
jgi:hypothetical protein